MILVVHERLISQQHAFRAFSNHADRESRLSMIHLSKR